MAEQRQMFQGTLLKDEADPGGATRWRDGETSALCSSGPAAVAASNVRSPANCPRASDMFAVLATAHASSTALRSS